MGTLSGSLRIAVLERDGYRCVYCGATAAEARLEVDHVIPRAGGGRDEATNLVTACRPCNNGKRDSGLRLPAWVVPAGVVRPVRRARRRVTAADARELIWPVGIGIHRGWPLPDLAWDQWCAPADKERDGVLAYLPWAVVQERPDWYFALYTCKRGHAWSCGHGSVASWPEVSAFTVSPYRVMPSKGYLRAHSVARPELLRARLVTYPPDFPESGVPPRVEVAWADAHKRGGWS
jgi:hypothetical protein